MKHSQAPSGYYELFPDQLTPRIRAYQSGLFSFLAHFHVQIEILHILSGVVEVTLNPTPYTLVAGDTLFIAPNQIHRFTCI